MIGRRLATAAAVVAIGTGLTIGTAPAANAQQNGVQLKCGFDTDVLSINAYYTHCDSNTYVVIKISGTPWTPSEMCVGPGETWLGSTMNYTWAEYAGRLC
ncbi:DUF6355 family natural product biosynthesis protein [Kribbella sp. CA-293567]|uniref:DUF6355 family natural product biosynthesis protein n=1 Tax=Kribbella sp. CA-293567 TaxID=3002436 RepID=UPI0022DE199E|nr:DUF6355 family natural product biosynthesis protein [Kribbella sp. CA-293567]WBQ07722.1 DUF6355 family natural product biosynthesis protein [Kribbella sp. CA-293567]